jgi:hypothetical protein
MDRLHWINPQGAFDLKQVQGEAGARIDQEVMPLRQRAQCSGKGRTWQLIPDPPCFKVVQDLEVLVEVSTGRPRP